MVPGGPESPVGLKVSRNWLLMTRRSPGSGPRGPRAAPGRPLRDTRVDQNWPRTVVAGWIASPLLFALATSCATLACHPLTVVVAQKEERARLERAPHGIRTTETGHLEENRRAEVVRDYWVRAQDGTWYPVPVDGYRAAKVGRPLELCR